MQINHNISALKVCNMLGQTNNMVEKSLEKLSSGYRINRASDDTSGIVIARKMKTQIAALDQSSRNASDGISVIQTAEGALTEIESMLQRMRELAVQAASDTNTDADRANIQSEIEQLNSEIQRISESTEFNTKTVLDGTFDNKVYSTNSAVNVISTSDNVNAGNYSIKVLTDGLEYQVELGPEFSATATVKIDGNNVKISDINGFKMEVNIGDNHGIVDEETINFTLLDAGPLMLQVGAQEAQCMKIKIPKVDSETLGISNVDVSYQEDASEAITTLDRAVDNVSSIRAKLGAYQNRLEYAISSVEETSLNMTQALSRIEDVDMAKEMSTYTSKNVIIQAATSVLAQANEQPQTILSLLQG